VIWTEGQPYVIEDIPALRCAACAETFIENGTAEHLDRVCRQAADTASFSRKIEVPVVVFPEVARL
jgi:hypothetical protein